MLSVMTVRINDYEQAISVGGKITLSGILSFKYYERKQIVEKTISFIASSTAVLAIIDSDSYGVAIGYIDNNDNKTPVFKIQQFIPSFMPVEVEDPNEALVVEVV